MTGSSFVREPIRRSIFNFVETFKGGVIHFCSSFPTPAMLPFSFNKSNLSPLKKGTGPRVDCRSLFPAEHHTEALSPTESGFSRRDQALEDARKSTQDIMLHGAPLPLIWVGRSRDCRVHTDDSLQVLVLDNVIPDYAVPLLEAHGGPQFIARAFLEVRWLFILYKSI